VIDMPGADIADTAKANAQRKRNIMKPLKNEKMSG